MTNSLEKYWQGLSWSLAAVLFRVFIGIGSSIVFVRYLGSKDYGTVVLMADFVTIAIVVFSMGLGVVQTRILPPLFVSEKYGQAKDFIFKSFTFRIGLSLIASFLIYSRSSFFIENIYPGVSHELMVIALLIIPIQMTGTCLKGLMEVTYRQKIVGIGDVSGLLVRLLLVVPVIIFDLGVIWFFLTQLFADFYIAVLYMVIFRKYIWKKIKAAPRELFKGRIWSFGIIMMLTLLANKFLGKEMDTQILSFRLHESGLPEIAIYSISFMLVQRSLSFIGIGSGGVNNLNQSIASELVALQDMRALRKIYQGQVKLYYFIIIPLIAGSFVLAEPILTIMYGNYFRGSGNTCAILFLGIGVTVVNYINYPILFAFGYERFLLFCRAFFGIINVLLSLYLSTHGAFGVAAATGLSLLGIAIVESFFVKRVLSFRLDASFFMKTIFCSLIMMVSIYYLYYVLHLLPNLPIANLLLSILLGIVSYFSLMFFVKPFTYEILGNFENLPKPFKIAIQIFSSKDTDVKQRAEDTGE